MKIAIKILFIAFAIIGIIGSYYLGTSWNSDLSEADELTKALGGAEFASLQRASYCLIFCSIGGLAAASMILLGKWKKNILCIILIAAGLLPLFLNSNAFFGIPMIIAGLIGFSIKTGRTGGSNGVSS